MCDYCHDKAADDFIQRSRPENEILRMWVKGTEPAYQLNNPP